MLIKNDLDTIIQKLEERLPELEWKLNNSSKIIFSELPTDLFPKKIEGRPAELITLLKQEIQRLSEQKNDSSCYYLAQKLYQKINLLVLCLKLQKTKSDQTNFYPPSFSNRQQFIANLQEQIQALNSQHHALNLRISKTQDTQVSLQLKKELGQIEKRLTEIKENSRLILKN